ncbi:4009_t:CDS:2, partial [Ambispora leptoticha]
TSTTTSPTSPSKTQPSPTASDIPRENIAALWRQREKEQKSESIKPSRPPLPPKKKTVLDKWNEQKAVTAAESDKISTGADNSNVGKVSGIIKKKSLETSSKNKENDSSKVSLTTTKSTTSVTSSSSETETVSVEIKENVEISQEEEQIEISEREGTVVQETQISKNIEANEKGVDASNPPEIPSGGIKKKNKIAAMFEEQERKRREEEAAAAAARPVPGRKVLNKLPWMQKEKDESTSNTLAAAPPPPRKLNAAFLTSTENTESDSTTTEPPKLKTGKIDSAISQRLESVFGSGKIQLPGMGRGIGIGGRKVLISAEDVEAEEGEERVRVIPGLKRPDLAERNSDESKKEHEEKIENKDAGEGGSAEEKHEKKTSKPLSHITKDRPRRPKPARALPPPPKTEKVDDSKTSVSDKTVIESSTLTTEEEAIKEEKQEEGEIEEVEKKEIGEVVIMNEEKEIADDVVVMAESEEKEMADDAVAMAEFEEKELDNEVIVIENVTN